MMGKVTIVDYGMGNLWSIQNALATLGFESVIESSPEKIENSERLILPGVGSFARAMHNLNSSDLLKPLSRAVLECNTPVLGICLGMQLLADLGTEDGETKGLGWISGKVIRLDRKSCGKVPHLGFDSVKQRVGKSSLFDGLNNSADFYFVHSYHFIPKSPEVAIAECDYGSPLVAAVMWNHIAGVQFHPEKSQANGLRLLQNFCRIPRGA
jgi:imidazole glycerol-phosphate synthase subunit HisH